MAIFREYSRAIFPKREEEKAFFTSLLASRWEPLKYDYEAEGVWKHIEKVWSLH